MAISVCDITRAQPRPQMLRAILEEMPEVRTEDITVFIATGTHRGNTAAEVEAMLGPDLAGELRVVMHDSRDSESLTYMGETSNGVPVLLNREWVESDFKITTGFVEPHFFAGFSGGPKMVAPGLAGLDTVMVLHDAKRIGHPRAVWGVTDGNPVHHDVREIARLTGVDFALDVTLNRDQQITAVFAGDLSVEHAAACEAARRDAMQPVEALFDVVVTTNSGYPLDQNLYQSVKGISAAAEVVKPGGQIICVAECRDGLPDHGAYAAILAEKDSPGELLEMINSPGYSDARPVAGADSGTDSDEGDRFRSRRLPRPGADTGGALRACRKRRRSRPTSVGGLRSWRNPVRSAAGSPDDPVHPPVEFGLIASARSAGLVPHNN